MARGAGPARACTSSQCVLPRKCAAGRPGGGGGAPRPGAVGVRFLLGDRAKGRTICFVNSHLNAHSHNVQRRQEDYEKYVSAVRAPEQRWVPFRRHTRATDVDAVLGGPRHRMHWVHAPTSICKRMLFFSEQPLSAVTPPNNLEALKSLIAHDTEDAGPALAPANPAAGNSERQPAPATALPADDSEGLRLLEHDLVIWLGDLNYRIELPREEILTHAEAKDWDHLHQADQLR